MVANFYWIIFPREIGGYQQIRCQLSGENGEAGYEEVRCGDV
jgi:hypothetical protein